MPLEETNSPVDTTSAPETQPQEPMSIREALVAADESTSAATPDAPAKEQLYSQTAHRTRDTKGRYIEPRNRGKSAAGDVSNGAAAAAKSADLATAEGGGKASPAEASSETAPTLKAPTSWKPAAREEWTKIPSHVQQEIYRREKEITQKLNEVAEPVRGYQRFLEVVRPHEAIIRASGMDPYAAVNNLLQTATVLRTAPPVHKAQLVAKIVKDFGVPIEALDQALAGQVPQGNQQHSIDPNAIASQAAMVAEQRLMAQLKNQHQQMTYKKQEAMVDSFGDTHEFFEDVRFQMADILAARGEENPGAQELEEVYELATRYHPEISKVVKQRELAKSAQGSQAAALAARRASSSVRSQPAAAVKAGGKPKSIREALEAASEEVGRRG